MREHKTVILCVKQLYIPGLIQSDQSGEKEGNKSERKGLLKTQSFLIRFKLVDQARRCGCGRRMRV